MAAGNVELARGAATPRVRGSRAHDGAARARGRRLSPATWRRPRRGVPEHHAAGC